MLECVMLCYTTLYYAVRHAWIWLNFGFIWLGWSMGLGKNPTPILDTSRHNKILDNFFGCLELQTYINFIFPNQIEIK